MSQTRTFFAAGPGASPVDLFFEGLRAGTGASSFLGCAAMRDDLRVSAIAVCGTHSWGVDESEEGVGADWLQLQR